MPNCYVLYECHYCNKLYKPQEEANECCGIGVDILMYCSECDKYIDDCRCDLEE